ncbi:MAG TPA: type II toxin-antitoxin system prevent-host-death family antitoxin [Gemmatimonadaceae bacterium]|jgi:prevent-host-death family protein|nr:type II toxin-antitoxin system prevent-host-death family antitoxin [Gemmatimonadaceae bacterium]
MKTASISYAKAHLSAVLDRVRSGQSVVITDRGTPVARIEPITTAEWSARFRSLVERGLATPPKITPTAKLLAELPPPAALARCASLVESVLDEREQGW